MINKSALSAVLLLVFLSSAFAPRSRSYEAALKTQGEIHLYLQPLPQEAHRLKFSIRAISAIRHDGAVILLPQFLTELKGKELRAAQKHLSSASLAPGLYKGISIEIERASWLGEQGETDLLVPDEALFVEQEFAVARKRASVLFLALDPDDLVSSSFLFSPVFSFIRPQRQLKNLLGFVTNSATNLVSVLNKNTMQVVDVVATGSGPKGAVLDQRRGWIYIALAGDDAIEAMEVSTRKILGRVRLNFGDEPIEIALSPDGRTLVSANYGSNTASIIDTSSLREVLRLNLPSKPTSVVMGTSSPLAYVLQASSNALSVIDLTRRRLVATRILEEAPVRGAISKDGDRLYVITRNSPNLLVMDPENLSLADRIFVGTGAASIKVDSKSGLTYVGKENGEIAVIDPSSLMFIDTFELNENAAYLAIDNDENGLFALLPDSNRIKKLDLISKKLLGSIEVKAEPYAVVIMGER